MKRGWRKVRSGRGTGLVVAGVAVVLGAAMLGMSALPSARRYLRLRRM